MTIRKRQGVFLVAGLLNILVISSSAGLWDWLPEVHLPVSLEAGSSVINALSSPLRAFVLYRGVSGGFTSYGFFAPEVPSRLRVRFKLHGPTSVAEDVFLSGSNHEATIRVSDIEDTLRSYNSDPKVRRALLASLAGKELALHPEAESIDAIVEIFQVPTIKDTVAGQRPAWIEAYTASFRRGAES